MADQLVTLAQVKARIFPVGLVDVTEDTLLTDLIEQASDYIQGLALRRFVPEVAQTYVVDTAPGSVIQVRRGIRAVTSLSIAASDQPDAGGAYVAVAAADILLRPLPMDRRPGWPATRILIRGATGRLSAALNGAVVVGDFGFVSTPPIIQAVALDAVATAYTAKESGDSDAAGPDGSPVAVWAKMFSEGTAQRDILDRFRAGAGIG